MPFIFAKHSILSKEHTNARRRVVILDKDNNMDDKDDNRDDTDFFSVPVPQMKLKLKENMKKKKVTFFQ